MAAFNVLSLSLSFKEPISNPYFSASSNPIRTFSNSNRAQTSPSSISARSNFTWDDVLHISHLHDDPSDLRPYFAKIRLCNQGSELQSEFVPFVVEDQIAGYVHNGFLDHLRKFHDVFAFSTEKTSKNLSNGYVMLHPSLKSPDDRTRAVGDVIKLLGEVLVPGIRNELYPVMSSFGMPEFFSLERAAAPYFGIKAYGVHMNGYVNKGGQKYLWLGKRSNAKPTFPGMLDHLVAGGLPHGISSLENLLKECEEEAGISRSISCTAVPVGAVSYVDINGHRYKRDVLFCYDLELPDGFVPANKDREVESFRLMPVSQVARVIRMSDFFKPNCNLVIIDFLFRHGFINPEDHGYLQLLQSLRSGECS